MHYLLYGHGGSFNHGGEALVQTTIKLLRSISLDCRITLSTHFPEQDRQFKIDADEFIERDMTGRTNEEVYAETIAQITSQTVCIHLGGDNYCYKNWERYALIHQKAIERGAKSLLWSCSIDKAAIDPGMLKVLRTHHLITARESMTCHTLLSLGLKNVVQVSDIAFLLEAEETPVLPDDFVAFNISPLVMRKNSLILEAFQILADDIITNTNWNIILIPHVWAAVDNDRDSLSQIKRKDEDRFVLCDNLKASEYKYIISKARFGVFARTHASIAAYASLVPTLAIGYSVKAFGIANDLGMGEYVVDVNAMADKTVIKEKFQKLLRNEMEVKGVLEKIMPEYIRCAVNARALEIIRGE